MKKQNGFSLFELLIVLLIFTFLAAIALPSLSGVVSRSRETSAHYNAQSVANAYTVARASGINFSRDKLEVIKKLCAGVRTPNGTYLRVTFPAEYDSMVEKCLRIDESSGEMFLKGISSSH